LSEVSLLIEMPAIAAGIARLSARKPFDALIARAGLPDFERRTPGFGSLLHIIIEQQISYFAAQAMWARLVERCDPLTPENFLTLDDETLKPCGFTRQKRAYARGLAEKLLRGETDLEALTHEEDEIVHRHLTALKGIGAWTSEIYRLFALGRGDVWPAKDVALLYGVQWLEGWAEKPSFSAMSSWAAQWAPYRSAAAVLAYHCFLSTHAARRAGGKAVVT
jgi:DNA-3-methyladenine glycosylase II